MRYSLLPARCLAVALVLGSALAGSPSLASATPGSTLVPHSLLPARDVVADAKRQATTLRLRVAALRDEAEQATEAYNGAYDELGTSLNFHVQAERALADAKAAAGASGGVAGARVRALYMSGGSAGLYASVLSSDNVTEALTRMHQVGVILSGDSRVAVRASDSVARRQRAEVALATNTQNSHRLETALAAKADTVRSLLAQADTLLATADARVVLLAEQQQRAADAAAAARAAATLARLQAQAAASARAGNLPAPVAVNPPPAAAGNLPPAAAGNPPTPVAGELPPGSPASSAAAVAIAFARAQLGKPYLWGATGPDSYDCSGLTGAAYAAAGVHLPRTSRQQWFAGPHVGLATLQPGDLLFWASNVSDPGSIHHEALYIGQGMMIAAPHSGAFVQLQPIYLEGYMGAVRPTAGG